MPPSLRPMPDEKLTSYLDGAREQYIKERITAGEPPDEARRSTAEQINVLFPGGRPAPGQLLYEVLDDGGTVVGSLWIGPYRAAQPGAYWVWDVKIEEGHRGRGLGRATMLLAESEARAHGATELGLNVFGHNRIARHLYESLDYATTAVNMRKLL